MQGNLSFFGTLWKTNRDFWIVYVPEAWDKTPFDGKLAWIVFITYGLCILTLLEVLVLK